MYLGFLAVGAFVGASIGIIGIWNGWSMTKRQIIAVFTYVLAYFLATLIP